MPSPKNLNQVKDLTDKLKQAKSVVLADYRGLSVSLQQDLRQKVFDAGGELLVVKNTLLKIALKDENFDLEPLIDSFTGPTITLLAYEDSISPIKALAEFAKEHDLPQIKAGFLSKDPLTKDQVEAIAKLPSKLELLAQTVATIKAPLTGFVNVLSGNIRNLIYVLEAIKQNQNQKGGGN